MGDEELLTSAVAAYRRWLINKATAEMCPADTHQEELTNSLKMRNVMLSRYAASIPSYASVAPNVTAERRVEEEVMWAFAKDIARIAPRCPTLDSRG